MITQKKSYITQPGQKPFERSKLIPNKGNITTEQFLSDVNKNKNPKTQVTPTKQEVKKPVVGSKENPKQLPEITVTAKNKMTPTKQSTTVNNKKTTVKPKEEVKTAPKQTYLKPKGEVNQKVVDWQNKLKAEGFDLGKVNGIWGKKTEAAYQAYLKNKQTLEKVGLPEDNAIFLQPRQGFPTLESAYLKKGGTMKKKSKKCSCGCAMKISKNAKGGLIESCACGCNMRKVAKGENGLKTKQVKPTTNDSIQAHNRLNAGESESGKGPQTKQEVINRLRKGNFGPGNTKAAFDKELKNKK